MRGKRDYSDFLDDIVQTIDKIEDFIAGMDFENFTADEKTIFAVVRGLEVIGEAVKNIPDEVKENNPEIPWNEIAGMRDKLIHAYFGVDVSVVWMTTTSDLPDLKSELKKLNL